VAVFNTAGTPRFILDGNSGLQSASGDVAERFPSAAQLAPGSVVSIDPAAGGMIAASRAYDRRVAGVVSGANDYNPGITLRAGDELKQAVPVTLTGTVYCLASNVNGPDPCRRSPHHLDRARPCHARDRLRPRARRDRRKALPTWTATAAS
jgi:hypothetical protein